MTPEYLGYAIVLLFLDGDTEWSVYLNAAGVLVTQEPNVQSFEYPDYDKFAEAFPVFAEEIKNIMMWQMQQTVEFMKEIA
jgi:hypothetical protein